MDLLDKNQDFTPIAEEYENLYEINKKIFRNNSVFDIITYKTNMGRYRNINGEIWKKRGTDSISQTAETHNKVKKINQKKK